MEYYYYYYVPVISDFKSLYSDYIPAVFQIIMSQISRMPLHRARKSCGKNYVSPCFRSVYTKSVKELFVAIRYT